MNAKEKKQWIINYIKKNKMEDILAEKYKNGKENVLKKYSNEIQSICSILSIIIIGFASLFFSAQNNYLTEKQTEIMKNEQKPIIDILIEKTDNSTDKLFIVNKGTGVIDFDIEIITYLDVLCNENNMGFTPMRVYLMNAVENLEYTYTDKLAEITLYKESCPIAASLKSDLHGIISEYTNLYWDFSLTYLIKVTSIDLMHEINENYFIYNRFGVRRVKDDYGNKILDECNYMIDNHDGTKTSKESYFDFKAMNAKQIFKYALNKIRDHKLYQVDFLTNEKYLYGEYEP